MKRFMVKYTVKPGLAAENEAFVHGVFDELRATAPGEFRYATIKLEDGATFIHIVSLEAADGANPIPGMKAFQAFQAGLPARCTEKPVVTAFDVVDAYALFAGS